MTCAAEAARALGAGAPQEVLQMLQAAVTQLPEGDEEIQALVQVAQICSQLAQDEKFVAKLLSTSTKADFLSKLVSWAIATRTSIGLFSLYLSIIVNITRSEGHCNDVYMNAPRFTELLDIVLSKEREEQGKQGKQGGRPPQVAASASGSASESAAAQAGSPDSASAGSPGSPGFAGSANAGSAAPAPDLVSPSIYTFFLLNASVLSARRDVFGIFCENRDLFSDGCLEDRSLAPYILRNLFLQVRETSSCLDRLTQFIPDILRGLANERCLLERGPTPASPGLSREELAQLPESVREFLEAQRKAGSCKLHYEASRVQALSDCLMLFSSRQEGLRHLKAVKCYPILREAHQASVADAGSQDNPAADSLLTVIEAVLAKEDEGDDGGVDAAD